MTNQEMISKYGYEQISYFNNEKAGLKCIIAVHSTKCGPALGGCRLFPYASEEEALFDVLRLSRGMSYKNSAANLPLGGAKAVIIADPKQKTDAMLEAFGECVETFKGRYLTAEDVNTDTADMDKVLRTTDYVTGRTSISGDPSPFTALGCFEGIKAVAKYSFGADSLDGMTFAVQGLGNVGYKLAAMLKEAGGKIIACGNSKPETLKKFQEEYGAEIVDKSEIFSQKCDFLVPCAMGGVINYETLPQLKCKAVAGCANNQILDDECARALKAKGIAYAPDYIINAGGVINVGQEAFTTYDAENVRSQCRNIYNTVYRVLEEAGREGLPEGIIADRIAEERL